MKRTLSLLVLACTLAAARADLVLEQKIEGSIQNGNLTMKLKGEKVRVDMPAGPMGSMSSIMDLGTGDSLTLIHGQKMAMKVSGAQTKQMMEMMQKQLGGGTAGGEAPKLVATGKTEKVGDYDTEIYTWSGPNGSQTLWVAKNFPNYAKFKEQIIKLNNSPAGGMAKGMSPDMSTLPGMVVKTQMEASGQKFTSTLISLKEEAVDPALFEAPKDYSEMKQPTVPLPAAK